MISSRQFKVGDWIRLGDVEGQVRSINWRTVEVATLTGDLVIIPNSQIARDRLRVFGADANLIRILVDVKVSYEHPPELVQDVLLKAARATKDCLLDPPPGVRITSYDDFAITYRAVLPVREFRHQIPVRGEFLANVWYAAERAGIAMPARYNHRFELPREIMRQRIWKPAEIVARIMQLGTFHATAEAVQPLAEKARIEIFRKGETLINAGQRGETVYIVLSGTAEMIESDAGRDTVVDAFEAGDLIVFKAFFRGGAAPATVRAAWDLEVVAVPIDGFETVLARDAHLAQDVEHLLTLRDAGANRVRAKGAMIGHAAKPDADRVQILKDLFRV